MHEMFASHGDMLITLAITLGIATAIMMYVLSRKPKTAVIAETVSLKEFCVAEEKPEKPAVKKALKRGQRVAVMRLNPFGRVTTKVHQYAKFRYVDGKGRFVVDQDNGARLHRSPKRVLAIN